MNAEAMRVRATELAAQCWCKPETSGFEMNSVLCEQIVDAMIAFATEVAAEAQEEEK